MKKLFAFVLLATTLLNSSHDDDNTASEINIRLSNVSPFTFQNITVKTTTDNINFENIDAGQMSHYKKFTKAYSYVFVELSISGETYNYVG